VKVRKFRKKPVVIEAMQFTGFDSYMAICDWARPHLENPEGNTLSLEESFRFEGGKSPLMLVRTLEGTMAANPGDWIIRGVKDEFYPVQDEIFQETYEAVSDAT
jgi:hypothetical protein